MIPTYRRFIPQVLASTAKNLLLFELGLLVGLPTIIIPAILDPNSDVKFTEDQSSWFGRLIYFYELTGNVRFINNVVLFILQIPETPIWLISKGKIKEAEKSLCWLRGWVEPEAIKQELDHTVHYYHDTANKKQGINPEKGTDAECIDRDASLKHDDQKSTDSKIEYSSARPDRLFSVDLNDGKVVIDSKMRNSTYGTTEDPYNGDSMVHFKAQTQNVTDKNTADFKVSSYNVNSTATGKESLKERISYFFRREMMHPLLLMLVYLFFTVFNARVTITPYYVLLAKDLNLSMDPFTITVVFSVTTLVGTVICMIVVRWTGKRFLALLTSVSLTVLLFALGYYTWSPTGQAQQSTWIPFFLLIVIHIFFGLTVVPWLYMSEIFPFRGRGFATSLLASMFYVYGFFATKLYFQLISWVSLNGLFFAFSFINLISFVFLYFCLLETEGKTLAEIEQQFKKKTNKCF
ncbi:facilitated trehalose transporter Tret1 [Nilaparvata lugens]|uniref:facilitated trehalose transporter Tret1 n=1 Tax=Nilaparvata lugens TaxID=108931 RepID=UPI00193CC100|nr:facilitated trehalose transporter Tret1 [Nilaparvata lugens]